MMALEQIKASYEVNDMTPEEIADDQKLDLTAVKIALMNCSSKYRKACGKEDDEEDKLNFSNHQLKEVNQVIFEAATTACHPDGSIDYKTRSQNAQYIRDDKKGRKEPRKIVASNTFNILGLNQKLAELRDSHSEMKQLKAC